MFTLRGFVPSMQTSRLRLVRANAHYPPYFTYTMFFVPAARNAIKSTMIDQLEVSPLHNQALVTYKNGNQYLYSNIDEDAMFDILFHNVESFGKWVNKFCKAEGVTCFPIAA